MVRPTRARVAVSRSQPNEGRPPLPWGWAFVLPSIQIATSYIPRSIADGTPIAEEDSGVGGISSRLAELGHAQHELEERITVRPPTEREARFLEMEQGQRVYDITHIGWTADERAVN